MISVSGGAAGRVVKTRQTGEVKIPVQTGADQWAAGDAFIAPVNPLKSEVRYKAFSDTDLDEDWIKGIAKGENGHAVINDSVYVVISGDGSLLNYKQAAVQVGSTTPPQVGKVVIYWELIEYE